MAARKPAAKTKAAVEANISMSERLHLEDIRLRDMQKAQTDLVYTYKKQEKVEIRIAPQYRAHFGKIMPVVLNGIPIYIPIDGKSYKIPKSYAMEVQSRIRKVDDQFTRQERLANIRTNSERYIGERDLIQPAK